MAARKNNQMPSFDDFIQADRKKKKMEELASEILGSRSKSRHSSAPGAGVANNRRAPANPSLASRVGVTKRSSLTPKPATGSRLQNSITRLQRAKSQTNVARGSNGRLSDTSPPYGVDSISIKGAAGPSIVVASNFAPGTTAADIETVMVPVGGEVQYCKLVSANPTVIAEMAFLDKAGAENVIAMFNGKQADGRTLYVYMKEGGPHQFANSRSDPRPPYNGGGNGGGGHNQYIPTGPRKAMPSYQDGRYGF